MLHNSARLVGVHPDLVKVVLHVASLVDVTVVEGLRTLERQKEMVATGKSQTMNSRHLDGHAVDLGVLVNGQIDWTYDLYARLAGAVKVAAAMLKVPVEWGGDWKTFKDGDHFQLPFAQYPTK
jgi:peptidoglycan L-alanyl-D-glutamate endopeptidase CwlK